MSNKLILLKQKIIKDNNPLIREKSLAISLPIGDDDLLIAQELKKYIDYSIDEKINKEEILRAGVGISAIQLGYRKSIIYLNFSWKNQKMNYTLINAKILSHSAQKCCLAGGEGCLSVDSENHGKVYRYQSVKIKAFVLEKNKEEIIEFMDFPAIVIQHEIDHLKGIIFTDYLKNIVNNDPGENPIEF